MSQFKTIALELGLSDFDVSILDNIISLVKEHGKKAKVIPLLSLCQLKKNYLTSTPRKAYEKIKEEFNKDRYTIVFDGKKNTYMLDYIGALIYIKKQNNHCLYLSKVLNDEQKPVASEQEIMQLISQLFRGEMENRNDFCFSLKKSFKILGFNKMTDAIAIVNLNLDPDIEYIRVLDDITKETDFLMTPIGFLTLIFVGGTDECKIMRRNFSKCLMKYHTGDISAIPEIIENANIPDNFNITLLDGRSFVTGNKARSKGVSIEQYNKLKAEYDDMMKSLRDSGTSC